MAEPDASTITRPILLAAGGTGGHLFPAEALARELVMRGHLVELASDERALQFTDRFPASALHQIPSGTVTGSSLGGKLKGGLKLLRGVVSAHLLLRRVKPAIVVGFGGYPTVPPVLAAAMQGIPTLIHEQNAVMGRANLFLSGRVRAIATGFPMDERQLKAHKIKQPCMHVGNPVREAVLRAAIMPMPEVISFGKLSLCVFGGSQGARIMSEIVPDAVELVPPHLRHRLSIVQQAREEDILRVKETYFRIGVDAQVKAFFADLPQRIAESHLVIARGGASTVAELAVIGRSSILVPLPGSLDQDQAANARVLEKAGAAKTIRQPEFTARWLAQELTWRLENMQSLVDDGYRAKLIGIPDAAARLANLVLQTAAAPRHA